MIQSKHQYNGKINYMSSANEFCFPRKKMNFVLQMNVNKIIYNSIIMLDLINTIQNCNISKLSL
jgi:hypothetical protein